MAQVQATSAGFVVVRDLLYSAPYIRALVPETNPHENHGSCCGCRDGSCCDTKRGNWWRGCSTSHRVARGWCNLSAVPACTGTSYPSES